MLRLKPCHCRWAIDSFVRIEVEIDSEYTATWSGRNSDQRIRPLPPPCLNLNRISARVLEPIRRQRPLATFLAG